MSVGTPPPLFRHRRRTATTIGMRIDLGIVRTFPTVGGVGFRGKHVKVTNLSASPPLNWSRDGAIAIDAERLFHWSTVRGKKLNL